MLRYSGLIALLVIAVLVTARAGVGRAGALVGASRHVEIAPAPPPALDQLRAEYRRPGRIPFPDQDRYTPAKALLGRMLYYDTRLSGSGALACASCHNAGFGYGDGMAKSLGDGMRPLDRHSPAIVNTAWEKLFMWDGRAASLEQQVLLPIAAPREMNRPLGPPPQLHPRIYALGRIGGNVKLAT